MSGWEKAPFVNYRASSVRFGIEGSDSDLPGRENVMCFNYQSEKLVNNNTLNCRRLLISH